MKTRKGFVSNSSSASFILTLENISKEDISNLLFVSDMYKDKIEIKEELEKRINSYSKLQEENNSRFDYNLQITEGNKLLASIEENNISLLNAQAWLEHIDVIKAEYNNIKIAWHTSMLNELGESTPEIVKEILLICSNKKIRHTLNIHHDGCLDWY